MAGKLGPLPRFLAISGTIFWAFCAVVAVSTEFFGGLLVAGILLIPLAAYFKLIMFMFESNVLTEIDSEPGTPGGISEELHQDMLRKERLRGPASRILPEPEGLLPAPSRVISSDSSNDAKKAEREDNREWSDMFRSL